MDRVHKLAMFRRREHRKYCNVCGRLPLEVVSSPIAPVIFEATDRGTAAAAAAASSVFEEKLQFRLEASKQQPLSLKWCAVVAFIREALRNGDVPIDIRGDVPPTFYEDFICYVFQVCLWDTNGASGRLLETLLNYAAINDTVTRINQYLTMNYAQKHERVKRYISVHSYLCRSFAYWKMFAEVSDLREHVFDLEKVANLSRAGNVDAKIILRFFPRMLVPKLAKGIRHLQLELFASRNARNTFESMEDPREEEETFKEHGPYVCRSCVTNERIFYGTHFTVAKSRANTERVRYALEPAFFCGRCGASLIKVNEPRGKNRSSCLLIKN